MSDIFEELDFSRTIKDFEYTRRAIRGIHETFNESDFDEMDSVQILQYLNERMVPVSFGDYLKRYVYEHSHMNKAFSEVELREYVGAIRNSFEHYHMLYSLTPTSRRVNKIVESWLTQRSVKREAVFVLGFGLHMSVEDVEEFLTKVLQESGFDFTDAAEAVYWHCFRNGFGYARAAALLKEAQEAEPVLPEVNEEQILEGLPHNRYFDLAGEDIGAYLACLRSLQVSRNRGSRERAQYDRLIEETKQAIAGGSPDQREDGKPLSADAVTSADIEKELYAGIPRTDSGNLKRNALSSIGRHFSDKRLSRQRMTEIQRGNIRIDRFDLITLKFFVTAWNAVDEDPNERCTGYIREINEILASASMGQFNPTNPYEAMIMLCLLSMDPLETFGAVWEESYR